MYNAFAISLFYYWLKRVTCLLQLSPITDQIHHSLTSFLRRTCSTIRIFSCLFGLFYIILEETKWNLYVNLGWHRRRQGGQQAHQVGHQQRPQCPSIWDRILLHSIIVLSTTVSDLFTHSLRSLIYLACHTWDGNLEKKTRKHAFDQENGQEQKKTRSRTRKRKKLSFFLDFLGQERFFFFLFFLTFLFSFINSHLWCM